MNRIENRDQRGRIPSFSPNPSGRAGAAANAVLREIPLPRSASE